MKSQATNTCPVVFLHGYSGEAESLRQFAQYHSGSKVICINLPGFGGTPLPPQVAIDNFEQYCELVWQSIRKVLPSGKVKLVGHSYGAMITFALACRHAEDVETIDLYCPVASPRLAPRLIVSTVRLARRLHLPLAPIIRLFKQPVIIDVVTRFMLRPEWSNGVKQRIIAMRRHEASYYSVGMFEIMGQALEFRSTMKYSHCIVPARICYATDDNVAGKRDARWYEQHLEMSRLQKTYGGHLGVVAEPKRLAKIFDGL